MQVMLSLLLLASVSLANGHELSEMASVEVSQRGTLAQQMKKLFSTNTQDMKDVMTPLGSSHTLRIATDLKESEFDVAQLKGEVRAKSSGPGIMSKRSRAHLRRSATARRAQVAAARRKVGKVRASRRRSRARRTRYSIKRGAHFAKRR